MTKEEKTKIIKWYIRNYIQTSQNIERLTIEQLETIVRTSPNLLGDISKCNHCTSDGKDYSKRCCNCIAQGGNNKNKLNQVDNYKFRYDYWKWFAETNRP